MSERSGDRDLLLDVSRLVWRVWRGGLPTGIDRVCLAYLCHYRARALAVVQRRGAFFVLSARDSDTLFGILLAGGPGARKQLVKLAFASLPALRRAPPRRGMDYINVGHTGLDEPSLPSWIGRHGTRAIYMVHDLIPITHPQYCRPGETDKHRRRMTNMLSSAGGVIANSQATLDDLANFAQAERRPVPASVVAWLGVDGLAPNDVRPTHLDVPHFVTIGTIEGRKNHILLLRIWSRLAERLGPATPKLVIIGQRGWEARQVFDQLDSLGPLQQHILELSRCSDGELAGFLAGAEALLMPSFAEGFGLPVVEALRLGTPVVASDLPALREVGGSAATYLDPQADAAWEEKVERLARSARPPHEAPRPATGYRAPDWPSHFEIVDAWLASL